MTPEKACGNATCSVPDFYVLPLISVAAALKSEDGPGSGSAGRAAPASRRFRCAVGRLEVADKPDSYDIIGQ